MRTGKISRILCDRVERRHDTRVPTAWVKSDTKADLTGVGAACLHFEQHAASVSLVRGAPILIMLQGDHARAMAELLAHAAAGERVYVVAPPEWGPSNFDPQLLNAPKVLIRRVPEVPVVGVHKPGDTRLWFGAKAGGTSPWSLHLDQEQAEAFRQVFLRLFWHEATDEAWTGGGPLAFRVAAERPFDVPEPSRTARIRLVDATAAVDCGTGGLVHCAGGSVPDGTPRRLWFPASGQNHQRLAALARERVAVIWEDLDLPDLVVGHRSGFARLPGKRSRLHVELNAAQAATASKILEQPTCWNFEVDTRLELHATKGSQLWLNAAPAAQSLELEQTLEEQPAHPEDLRSAPGALPPQWRSDVHPLALTVRRRWTVFPPCVPKNAALDELVGRWDKLNAAFADRVSKVHDLLRVADDHRGRLAKTFTSLLRGLLGFERTHANLRAQVASLQAERPSTAGSSGASALLARLAELEDQAHKLQGNLEDAERKAHEDEERDKQQVAWRRRVDLATRDLPTRVEDLTSAKAKQSQLELDMLAVEAELKSAPKDAMKDLQARQQRIADDRTDNDKAIKRLQGEVAAFKQAAAEEFTFTPPAHPANRPSLKGARFEPAASPARHSSLVPDEDLPEVGTLRSDRGLRYLVIETWDDLERGEHAASRLKARLVGPETT